MKIEKNKLLPQQNTNNIISKNEKLNNYKSEREEKQNPNPTGRKPIRSLVGSFLS